MILQFTATQLIDGILKILGLGIFSGVILVIISLFYRWYTQNQISEGVSLLIGLGSTAVLLNTTSALRLAIIGQNDVFTVQTSIITICIFIVSGITSVIGSKIGDTIGLDFFAITGTKKLNKEINQVVKSVGRSITVEIPEDVENIEGYDPVSEETKENLSGTKFVFPKNLTIAELQERIKKRIIDDYKVGQVNIEVTQEGYIKYLAVGSRAAGLGPTLSPGTVALAIKADPPYSASSGDRIQIWKSDGEPEKIVTGELRSIVDDIVTLTVHESEVNTLDSNENYRLVTLPSNLDFEREFISMLRAADETTGSIEISNNSPLTGVSIAALNISVVAMRFSDGEIICIPKNETTLKEGDTLYVIGKPEDIRRLEKASKEINLKEV